MSKKGLLKAEFNRVRTSTALKANDMWTNTIGQIQDPQAGSNSVIEASIYAPTRGGGNRAARQEKAQQLIASSGYQPTIKDYTGLMTLAKAQGIGNETRGACKLCGGLGHLTKKCTNVLTGHNMSSGADVLPDVASGPTGASVLGLLPEVGDLADFDSSDLSSSDSSDSEGTSSDSEDKKRKRKHKSKKEKKEKHKKKHKKSSKEKKHKRSRSSP
ncbi:hypothetical protein CEUSTIGMA_g8044.t1 [Chlamydomonas eustigma]|uniref:CCHC-type domain-containing protein n=1 Tax=Chlamydomonas eustigma TaxID=1157962 RepID=A0A250XCJ0_9CHLO|nr:hypothetical protein CEUSTIGMA_g8044.t1 [Chlamydomonas eustigma]|eukprot:GAX80609.1 hypothetical protein CEUSTIGMA_g8044.t1 [Chlamydomonas eustigma]